jgi:hypothetical protein
MLISLYLPYLHWDSYKRMMKRREIIKQRLLQGRSPPISLKAMRSDVDTKIAWKYLGYDPPFNCSRTLDQYAYPDLRDPRPRDDDQIIYKMTKEWTENGSARRTPRAPRYLQMRDKIGEIFNYKDEEREEYSAWQTKFDDLLDGKVLMVEQLWLWAPDTGMPAFIGLIWILDVCIWYD